MRALAGASGLCLQVAFVFGAMAAPVPVPTQIPPTTTTTTTTTAAPVLAVCVPSPEFTDPPIMWHASTAVGRHERGRLVDGVQLPDFGATFTTWDPGVEVSPSPGWRRWGTDRLIRTTLCVLGLFRHNHPNAARVVIGDISREHGGRFGPEYGGPGHASHQNGLDVDVYYPRRDGVETVPFTVSDVEFTRAQELVDRFVAAGAITIYVGPNTHLTGPAGIVRVARHHDNHLHVRFR